MSMQQYFKKKCLKVKTFAINQILIWFWEIRKGMFYYFLDKTMNQSMDDQLLITAMTFKEEREEESPHLSYLLCSSLSIWGRIVVHRSSFHSDLKPLLLIKTNYLTECNCSKTAFLSESLFQTRRSSCIIPEWLIHFIHSKLAANPHIQTQTIH